MSHRAVPVLARVLAAVTELVPHHATLQAWQHCLRQSATALQAALAGDAFWLQTVETQPG